MDKMFDTEYLQKEKELFGEAPQLGKVRTLESYQAGSIDEDMLSMEERNMVEQFAKEIDLKNSTHVMSYGASAQRNISEFSESMLSKVRTRDLGDIGECLQALTAAINSTVSEEPEKKGIFGFLKKSKRTAESLVADFETAEETVLRVQKNLEHHRITLMQDVSMFDQLYRMNQQYYKELTMYIIAGQKALEMARGKKLTELQFRAEQTGLQEDIQAYQDYGNACIRFEKKLHDLELTRVISIQTAPQVRMLQHNDEQMLEKLKSSIINAIPLWRSQMVMALGIEHSRRAIAAQNAVSDTVNNLLRINSETLKMATVETAKEAEKSVVDIETLKRCNKELISSINEVVKVHEQGSRKRVEAHEELVKIESELKQALLKAGSR